MAVEHRIKEFFKVAKLPVSFNEENRGFKRCCEKRLVLANGSSRTWENDVNSAWIKLSDVADTYEFQLLNGHNELTDYIPIPAPIPEEENAYYATIPWADVLASDGIGCYKIKIIANIGGLAVEIIWGEYELKVFSIANALGTARISCRFGLVQTIEGINFANSGVRDDLRFNGQIKKDQPNMEIDSLIYGNRRVETIVKENLHTFLLATDPYTDEVLKLLYDLYLLSENELFISDYNAHTSSYRIFDLEARVQETPERVTINAETRLEKLTCILGKRINNDRAYYGGQGVGSGSGSSTGGAPACLPSSYVVVYADSTPISAGTIPSGQSQTITIPNCPTVEPVDLEINGNNEGTFDSGTTIEVNLIDEDTNPVTPLSIDVTGQVVTIELENSGGGADADVTAFLTATGITDNTIVSAITDLVSDLKTNYLWNKISAIYPMVGGTATTHKFNLKDSRDLDIAHRMVFNGGWTHSSLGAISNGSNAYGDTKLNGQFEQTAYNEHLAVYIQDVISNGVIGASSNPTDQILQLGGTLYSSLSGGNGNGTVTADNGLYLCTRIDETQSDTYINGVSSLNYVGGITGLGNKNINYYIACRNDEGTPSFYGANTFSFVSIGKGFDATDQATYYTIIQNFQTALGRNV
jgi:hypothetical protein